MKELNKVTRNIIIIGICVVIMGYFISASQFTYGHSEDLSFLLSGKTEKGVYILGEPVKLGFEIKNIGNNKINVPEKGFDNGALKLFIADKKLDFKEVYGYNWGLLCIFNNISLEIGKTHQYDEGVILWNGKIDMSNFSESSRAEYAKTNLLTDYIFENPGEYFIKGVLISNKIESIPFKIEVLEPQGVDLQVWNKIKGNKQIAILLQSGELTTDNSEEKLKVVSEVESIVQNYPSSTYTTYLKPSLDKFKLSEAKRQEFIEKMKSQQKQKP
jgi:hypothetical protein